MVRVSVQAAGGRTPRNVARVSRRRGVDHLAQAAVFINGSSRGARRDRRSNLVEVVDRKAQDRKSKRLNSSHTVDSYAVFCLKIIIRIARQRHFAGHAV